MDYGHEEQAEDSDSRIEFRCEKCETLIDSDLTLELVGEYQYE